MIIIWGVGNLIAQPYPHTDPTNSGNWILNTAISDEFNGTSLDENKWQVCGRDGVYWAGIFTGRYDPTTDIGWQYSPDNMHVSDGILKIRTEYDPDYPWVNPGTGNYQYTTGGMWSKVKSDSTGYMEIRCKLADARTVAAFWTTGDDLCELDVFEAIGKHLIYSARMWSSLHDWSFPRPNHSWSDRTQLPFNFRDGFHTFAAEWDQDSLKIYADGQFVHGTSRDWVENTPAQGAANDKYSTRWSLTGGQHIWADAEIFPWWGIPDPNNLPADFEIEYIRVWQREGGPTAISDVKDIAVATGFRLEQNYPNPFNPKTNIRYQLPVESYVQLEIYNLAGQKVRTLVSARKNTGSHSVQWNGLNDSGQKVSSAIYLYTIRIKSSGQSFSQSRKMILMK